MPTKSLGRRDELISDILDLFSVTKDGEIHPPGRHLEYSSYVNLLYSILLDKNQDKSALASDIRQRLRRKKLLFDRDTGRVIGSELIKVFSDLKRNKKNSYDDFKQTFYAAIEDYAKKGQKKYSVIFPLNLRLEEKVASEIDGQSFKIVDFDEFIVQFNVRHILHDTTNNKLKEFLNRDFTFFIVEDVWAGNIEYAESYCQHILQFVLGFLTFCKYSPTEVLTYHGTRYGTYYPKGQISQISVSRALIFEREKFVTAYYLNEQDLPLGVDAFEVAVLNYFYSMLDSYRRIKVGTIADRLRDALVSYYQASTAEDIASSYLKYWVCIEFCLLKSRYDKESTIANILGNLPIWDDKYVAYKAQLLADKRNKYVHQLKTDVSQNDRNFAKSVAGSLISYVLLLANSFADPSEFHEFYKAMAQKPHIFNLAEKERKRLAALHPDNLHRT